MTSALEHDSVDTLEGNHVHSAEEQKEDRSGQVSTRALGPPNPISGITVSSRVLPPGASVAQIAEACRQAYQSFLFGVASGWGREHLVGFLLDTYSELAVDVDDRASRAFADELRDAPFGVDALIDPGQSADLLQATRREVLETLEYVTTPEGGRQFTFQATTSGWLVPVRDEEGSGGWLPVATPAMRLEIRILSLVAVDYFVRQEDYLARLAICHRCERAVFDSDVRARGTCCRVSTSGVWSPGALKAGAANTSESGSE